MSAMTKRTALGVLGLATVATPIAAEEFAKPLDKSGFRFGIQNNGTVAAALRKLADDIDGHGTLPQSLSLLTTVDHNEFVMHTLTLEFAMRDTSDRD